VIEELAPMESLLVVWCYADRGAQGV